MPVLISVLLLCQELSIEDRIVLEGRENSRVMQILDELVNGIGPRLTGTRLCNRACEWAKRKFEEMGLANATMEEWGRWEVIFERGESKGRMTAPVEKDLVFITPAWTPGTEGPVEGPARPAPSKEGDFSGWKGAWVIGQPSSPAVREALYRAGIAGIVRRGDEGDLLRMGGNPNVRWDRLPDRVSIKLLRSQFDEIEQRLKDGQPVRLEFDIRNRFARGPIPLYNVFADLRGAEKPEEFVIVGGHLDSWDAATGTTDNGTGSAVTLEAARILARVGAKPKRTIRFMLWTGEEQGLLGSDAWCRNHRDLMPRISAVFVHDGGTNYISGVAATESQVPIFERIFDRVKKLNPDYPFEIRRVERLTPGASDHASFIRQGVPGFYWSQAGRANYGYGWHTQNDRYDLAIPEYMTHSSVVTALAAYGVANLDTLLPRDGLRPAPESRRRRLGVNLESDGVTISSVVPGSAAERAGLQEGDVILQIGPRQVKDMDSLREAIQTAPKTTTARIRRDGAEKEVPVQFDE